MGDKPTYEELEQRVREIEKESIERKRIEKALQHKVEFQKLITTMSTKFISLASSEIDQAINQALQEIGEFVDVDRSYVFLFRDNLTKMDNTHEWCAKGIESAIQYNQDFLVKDFPWCEKKIKNFEVIHIPRVADLPTEAIEKEIFQSQQIKSLILVPMVYYKSLYGFIGFDSVRVEKTWSEDIIALLRIVGAIFANALERRQVEEALQKSEFKYSTLFEDSRDAIYITTREGKFVDVNQSALDLFGYNKEEMMELNAHNIYVNPGERDRFKQSVEGNGFVRDYEVKFRKKDGTEMDCLLTSTARHGDDGSVLGYQGIIRDITEAKLLEAQLLQSQKLEAIGTLSGGIAHDFNNLLTAIQMNASIMLHDIDSNHRFYRMLTNINNSVASGAKLTDQLLSYARKSLSHMQPVNLNHIVEEISYGFGRTRKEISIHLKLAKEIFNIDADRNKLNQVLLNLLINASDAMTDPGNITLMTTNVTHKDMKGKQCEPRPGKYVQLTVTDTGKGMDKETMKHIFEPFFTTKEIGQGTGLGLASAYGIIKEHGGHIDVDSEPGIGTTFTLYFPATSKKVEDNIKLAVQIFGGTGTILLVDDEDVVISVVTELLRKLGYTVFEARSGKEAIDIYKENNAKIDLIILDLIMPKMSGSEAYDRLKEINPKATILLSSGFTTDARAEEIMKRGCDAFLQKPFNMQELSQKIHELLGKK